MGWFIVSIVLPLIAPLVALAVFKTLPLPVGFTLIGTFKDGQLCWIALGFCASALYEIATPATGGPPLRSGTIAWINGALVGVLVLSAMTAAGGAVFSTPSLRKPGVKWYVHYKCLVTSLIMTLFAAACYAVVHLNLFSLNP